MPYLASNQDASEQEGHKTALMAAAVIFTTAALGAGYLSGKMPKGKQTGKKVAKNLYGGKANQLSKQAVENIPVRTAKDVADSKMTSYTLGKTWKGKDRVYSENKSFFGRFKDNHLNKDVRAFNKTIGEYKNGNLDNVYNRSKATLYKDLYDQTQAGGIGLQTKDLTSLTNKIHKSDANVAKRAKQGWTTKDDIRLTNDIWGGGNYSKTTARDRVDDYFTKDMDKNINQLMMKDSPEAIAKREQRAMLKDRSGDPYAPENQAQRLADRKAKAEAMRAEKASKNRTRRSPEELDAINAQLQKDFIDRTYEATGGRAQFGTGFVPGDKGPLDSIPSANYNPFARQGSVAPGHKSVKPAIEQPDLPDVIQLGNPSGEYAVMNNMKGAENELMYERWFNKELDNKLLASKPTDPYAVANSKEFADLKFEQMASNARAQNGAEEIAAMKQVQDIMYPTNS